MGQPYANVVFIVQASCESLDANIAVFREQLAEARDRLREVAAQNHVLAQVRAVLRPLLVLASVV